MDLKFIQYHTEKRVAYITLDRPEKRNALNAAMVEELKTAFGKAEKERSVKVIVLKANGKVFSAGADLDYLRELQENSPEENLADSRKLKELFLQIYNCPKAVIAQVQGHAIAGGCGLMTVCDFAFAVPEAQFGFTETKIGFVPALVAAFVLQKIGESRGRELLLTGELIGAGKALDHGLVNFIEEEGKLEEAVQAFALKLASGTSGSSIAFTKELISAIRGLPLAAALDLAAEVNARVRESDDFKKGIIAFLNKEKPNW